MYKLKKDAFLGILWNGGSQIFNQVVLLIVKLILVRLLIPEEFGLAAMAYIVVSSLTIINAFGTGTAFIRDNRSNPKKAKNTLFYLDAVAIILIAVIGFLLATPVAGFFGKKISSPEALKTLVWMFRVLALDQLLNVITIVPSKMLTKELKFKKKVIAGGSGTVAYGIIAPVLAYFGFGPWSIVIAQIANRIVSRIMVFSYSPFIPSLVFNKKIAKDYLNFGKNQFINSIVNLVIRNADDTLIGRILGAAALGFYSLGQHFAGLIVSIISGVISSVVFPVFSKLQDNKDMYTKAFFKVYRLKNMFAIPSIAGAMVLADWIVMLIFGERWMPILPVFYVLSISSFLSHLTALGGSVFNSRNKPYIIRNNRLIQFGFYVVLIYPFIKLWGLIGVALVFVIFSFVSIFYIAPKLAKEIPNFYSNALKIFGRTIFCTLIMAIIVYYIKKLVWMNFFWLFTLVFIGVFVYFIPMWFLDKDLKWDLQEAWSVVKEKLLISKR